MRLDKYICDICKEQAQNNPITFEPIDLEAIDGIHHICKKCFAKIKLYILKPKTDVDYA